MLAETGLGWACKKGPNPGKKREMGQECRVAWPTLQQKRELISQDNSM